jgi:NAD(P)-dependent dehydrogenase (short-subunit alcohol dehydrogenase family)
MTSNSAAPLADVAGKSAFITGASSGVGLGIARACLAAGMRVMITYLTEAHLRAAKPHLERVGGEFHALRVDVSDRVAMATAADVARDLLGNVHLLCNNAGVGIASTILDATLKDWDFAIGVNIGGVVNGIASFLPSMIAHAEPAHVVSTSSMSGLFHGGSVGVYTSTKFAVVGMMEALRAELAPRGIGVSVACPGLVATNIFHSGRNRPAELRNGEAPLPADDVLATRFKTVMEHGMDPMECGERILRGIRRNDMYILTHPEFEQGLRDRHEALLRSIRPEASAVTAERLQAERSTLRHLVYINEAERLSRERP